MEDSRSRVSQACDNCKRARRKCDGGNPCTNCSRRGVHCAYTVVNAKRGPRPGSIKATREMNARLTEEVAALKASLQLKQRENEELRRSLAAMQAASMRAAASASRMPPPPPSGGPGPRLPSFSSPPAASSAAPPPSSSSSSSSLGAGSGLPSMADVMRLEPMSLNDSEKNYLEVFFAFIVRNFPVVDKGAFYAALEQHTAAADGCEATTSHVSMDSDSVSVRLEALSFRVCLYCALTFGAKLSGKSKQARRYYELARIHTGPCFSMPCQHLVSAFLIMAVLTRVILADMKQALLYASLAARMVDLCTVTPEIRMCTMTMAAILNPAIANHWPPDTPPEGSTPVTRTAALWGFIHGQVMNGLGLIQQPEDAARFMRLMNECLTLQREHNIATSMATDTFAVAFKAFVHLRVGSTAAACVYARECVRLVTEDDQSQLFVPLLYAARKAIAILAEFGTADDAINVIPRAVFLFKRAAQVVAGHPHASELLAASKAAPKPRPQAAPDLDERAARARDVAQSLLATMGPPASHLDAIHGPHFAIAGMIDPKAMNGDAKRARDNQPSPRHRPQPTTSSSSSSSSTPGATAASDTAEEDGEEDRSHRFHSSSSSSETASVASHQAPTHSSVDEPPPKRPTAVATQEGAASNRPVIMHDTQPDEFFSAARASYRPENLAAMIERAILHSESAPPGPSATGYAVAEQMGSIPIFAPEAAAAAALLHPRRPPSPSSSSSAVAAATSSPQAGAPLHGTTASGAEVQAARVLSGAAFRSPWELHSQLGERLPEQHRTVLTKTLQSIEQYTRRIEEVRRQRAKEQADFNNAVRQAHQQQEQARLQQGQHQITPPSSAAPSSSSASVEAAAAAAAAAPLQALASIAVATAAPSSSSTSMAAVAAAASSSASSSSSLNAPVVPPLLSAANLGANTAASLSPMPRMRSGSIPSVLSSRMQLGSASPGVLSLHSLDLQPATPLRAHAAPPMQRVQLPQPPQQRHVPPALSLGSASDGRQSTGGLSDFPGTPVMLRGLVTTPLGLTGNSSSDTDSMTSSQRADVRRPVPARPDDILSSMLGGADPSFFDPPVTIAQQQQQQQQQQQTSRATGRGQGGAGQ